MNQINIYQLMAMRTNSDDSPITISGEQKHLLNAALGLGGEGGEFEDHVKKHVFHGHPLDREYLKKELGDTLWYAAQAATALKLNMSEILEANIEKLERRYPEGFSHEASINRSE